VRINLSITKGDGLVPSPLVVLPLVHPAEKIFGSRTSHRGVHGIILRI